MSGWILSDMFVAFPRKGGQNPLVLKVVRSETGVSNLLGRNLDLIPLNIERESEKGFGWGQTFPSKRVRLLNKSSALCGPFSNSVSWKKERESDGKSGRVR